MVAVVRVAVAAAGEAMAEGGQEVGVMAVGVPAADAAEEPVAVRAAAPAWSQEPEAAMMAQDAKVEVAMAEAAVEVGGLVEAAAVKA